VIPQVSHCLAVHEGVVDAGLDRCESVEVGPWRDHLRDSGKPVGQGVGNRSPGHGEVEGPQIPLHEIKEVFGREMIADEVGLPAAADPGHRCRAASTCACATFSEYAWLNLADPFPSRRETPFFAMPMMVPRWYLSRGPYIPTGRSAHVASSGPADPRIIFSATIFVRL